jgi:hypothetical protein
VGWRLGVKSGRAVRKVFSSRGIAQTAKFYLNPKLKKDSAIVLCQVRGQFQNQPPICC